jgi:hypothetical protein
MIKNALRAIVLLAIWCACAALIWRIAFRALFLSISDRTLRLAIWNFGMVTAFWVSYLPANFVHRRTGGSGSFLRWSVDVLYQAPDANHKAPSHSYRLARGGAAGLQELAVSGKTSGDPRPDRWLDDQFAAALADAGGFFIA